MSTPISTKETTSKRFITRAELSNLARKIRQRAYQHGVNDQEKSANAGLKLVSNRLEYMALDWNNERDNKSFAKMKELASLRASLASIQDQYKGHVHPQSVGYFHTVGGLRNEMEGIMGDWRDKDHPTGTYLSRHPLIEDQVEMQKKQNVLDAAAKKKREEAAAAQAKKDEKYKEDEAKWKKDSKDKDQLINNLWTQNNRQNTINAYAGQPTWGSWGQSPAFGAYASMGMGGGQFGGFNAGFNGGFSGAGFSGGGAYAPWYPPPTHGSGGGWMSGYGHPQNYSFGYAPVFSHASAGSAQHFGRGGYTWGVGGPMAMTVPHPPAPSSQQPSQPSSHSSNSSHSTQSTQSTTTTSPPTQLHSYETF